jgi:hypothetical protein
MELKTFVYLHSGRKSSLDIVNPSVGSDTVFSVLNVIHKSN